MKIIKKRNNAVLSDVKNTTAPVNKIRQLAKISFFFLLLRQNIAASNSGKNLTK